MAHRGGYHSASDQAAGAIVMLIGLIVIVLLILAVWLIIKAISLVYVAWRLSKGKSRELRTVLFTWFLLLAGLVAAVLMTAGHIVSLETGEDIAIGIAVLLGITTVMLLITARITELKYRHIFQREPETLVTKVLKRPWWTTQIS